MLLCFGGEAAVLAIVSFFDYTDISGNFVQLAVIWRIQRLFRDFSAKISLGTHLAYTYL